MKITNNIHQIKVEFKITENIKRFVYVYLITGISCYLIDSGVTGSEAIIAAYMQKIGRNIKEIKAIFLTHSHPDHIGGAAAIKQLTGCKIYANDKTRHWCENIDLQFLERPIPNFYQLVNQSVKVDKVLKNYEKLLLETNISFFVINTPGHSNDSTSYLYQEQAAIFIGDSIPTKNDLPIIIDYKLSMQTLKLLEQLKNLSYYCPAWDHCYKQKEITNVISAGKKILEKLYFITQQLDNHDLELEQLTNLVSVEWGQLNLAQNPLFQRSVLACRNK